MLTPLAHWGPLGAHSLGETSGQESVTYRLASSLLKLKDKLFVFSFCMEKKDL